MGKLFGSKERKSHEPDNTASLDSFLHSSADNLQVTHPPPPLPPLVAIPKLTKLDTNMARFPQAPAMIQQPQLNRPVAPGQHETIRTPNIVGRRPNKKGLVVRFVDSYPEIIGEGGEEADSPVMEISMSQKARRLSVLPSRKPVPYHEAPVALASGNDVGEDDDFQPKALSRAQTGYSSIHQPSPPIVSQKLQEPEDEGDEDTIVPGQAETARYLETSDRHDDDRRSFIETNQARMRQAEGQAFARASRTSLVATDQQWEEDSRKVQDVIHDSPPSTGPASASPEPQARRPTLEYSPAGSIASMSSITNPPSSQANTYMGRDSGARYKEDDTATATTNSAKLQDAITETTENAFSTFIDRTRHLFELFRLHAETAKPLLSCSLTSCSRASLWWFLKGRMGLEMAVRERSASPQAQMQNETDRQQAYANLAKAYWLSQEVIPEIAETRGLPADPDTLEVSQNLIIGLKKLALSMQKNGFLPPEDAVLPQTTDKSIWVEYPGLSQDVVALLTGNWSSGMTAMQHPMSTLHLLDAFPVGDTAKNFSYGRVSTDVYLKEQGRGGPGLHFTCMLSMVRPQSQTGVVFVIANQNGNIQLAIQENRNAGPIWDDVRWRSDTCTLEVKLPRGFLLVVQLAQQDFRTLWGMHDFGSKVMGTLYPGPDETAVFRNILPSFQYLDADPQSRMFPKEPVPQCDVALFEKLYKEGGPSGLRSWHCGFRIAVVTGPRTRTVSGVHHNFRTTFPVQFGFFRSDNDSPALSLKYENGRQKGRMVLIFNDEKERMLFHSILTGTALSHGERVFVDVPLGTFTVSQSMREPTGMVPFSRMPWKAARVVNDEFDRNGDSPSTTMADKLRMVLEYQNGTFVDRVNVAPGELRMRLEVSNAKMLRLLRQPQQDVTVSISEAQVPKELPRNMSDALQLLKNNQTIRTMEFARLTDLHAFQAAVTGFEVLFDALACTFAIARRRMVVPIHKKWEAGFTRIQVVRHADRQVQLLAFFENFQHGHCMNFVLKGTDTYEMFGRGGKSGIKFVDAKFPLPQLPEDAANDYDDMAFVSLDLPDLPGEHDDISIVFEKETGKLVLSRVLTT